MILNSPYISGSLTVTGNITAQGGINISGSIASASYAVSASEASKLQGLGSSSFAPAATFNTVSQSYAASSASLSTRVTNEEATSSVLTSASSSFATMSGSLSTRVTNLEATSSTVSQSFATTSGSISSRVTLVEGQYATTGSNTFTNVQYISSNVNAQGFTTSASLYTDGGLRVAKDSFVSGTAYFNNVVVYGTASIQYVTSSQINVGANIIYLNTQTPAVRYGGMAVADSGSNAGVTGSMLWDSVNNGWIYTRESGSTYSGGALISGPRSSVQGSEQGTLSNYVMKGQGGDHITASQIYTDDSSSYFYNNALYVTASGNVAVGLTSSAWNTFSSLQVQNAAMWSTADNNAHWSSNLYYNGADRIYISSNYATEYAQQSGVHKWFYASSGTTGGVVTVTEAMRISATGLVGIGTSSPSYILDVSGSTGRIKNSGGSADFILDRASTSAGATSQYTTAGTLKWYTGLRGLANDNFYIFNNATSTNTLILDSSTNAATFSSSVTAVNEILNNAANNNTNALVILGSGSSTKTHIGQFSNATYISNNWYYESAQTNDDTGLGGAAINLQSSVTSGATSINFSFKDAGTGGVSSKVAMLSNGNVGIGTTSPSYKFELAGSLGNFQLASSGAEMFFTRNENNDILATGGSSSKIRVGAQSQVVLGVGANYEARMTVTSAGNVGIGVTPSAWGSGVTALQVGTTNAFWNRASDGLTVLASNSYYNGSVDVQITTNTSNRIYFVNGSTYFERAASTAAGSNTPWVTSMTISSGGDVYIGGSTSLASGALIVGDNSSTRPIVVRGLNGVDANYTIGMAFYPWNTLESNAILNTVSSVASQSGFRFDVSNGASSTARTASMYINRTSVTVVGSLSKGSGSFKIKHPLTSKKNTHHLVHSFIEGPQADLIYRGKIRLVAGKATVNIDEAATMTEGTFEVLCRDIQCFTSNETSWDAVRGKVEGNILTIECQNTNSTDEISWMVIGERQDEHMMDTEWTDENGKVIVEPLIPEEGNK